MFVWNVARRAAIPMALIFTSLALSFLVLETGLRLIGYDPMGTLAEGRSLILRESQNPLRKYEPTPNSSGVAWRTNIRINSHGMRDRDYPVERTDALRVVAIGDSITFGNGIEVAARFTEVLEALLPERLGHPVEVLNLGVGGYDTLQEVATLEEVGVRFAPDLVILGYCVNDLGDTSPNLGYIRRLDQLNSRLYELRVAQLISTTIERLGLMRELGRANSDALFAERNRGFLTSVSDDLELMSLREELDARMSPSEQDDPLLSWYRSEVHLGKLAYALGRLAGMARTHGFEVVVAIIPFLQVSEGYDVAYRMVEHLAVARGLGAAVLARDLPAEDLERLRHEPRDPVHPNERGHRLIAEALAPLVAAKLRPMARAGAERNTPTGAQASP